jgi:hypothetical protein
MVAVGSPIEDTSAKYIESWLTTTEGNTQAHKESLMHSI